MATLLFRNEVDASFENPDNWFYFDEATTGTWQPHNWVPTLSDDVILSYAHTPGGTGVIQGYGLLACNSFDGQTDGAGLRIISPTTIATTEHALFASINYLADVQITAGTVFSSGALGSRDELYELQSTHCDIVAGTNVNTGILDAASADHLTITAGGVITAYEPVFRVRLDGEQVYWASAAADATIVARSETEDSSGAVLGDGVSLTGSFTIGNYQSISASGGPVVKGRLRIESNGYRGNWLYSEDSAEAGYPNPAAGGGPKALGLLGA